MEVKLHRLCELCRIIEVTPPRRICNDCLAQESAAAFAETIPSGQREWTLLDLRYRQSVILARMLELAEGGEDGEKGNEKRQRGSSERVVASEGETWGCLSGRVVT